MAKLKPAQKAPARLPLEFNSARYFSLGGEGKTSHEFAARRVIFAQGAASNSLYYILSGKVKLTVVSRGGKEAVIGVLGPSDFIGEGCLAGYPLRMATATTMTPCSVTRLAIGTVVEMLQREPVFSALLLTYTLKRAIRIEEDLIDQRFNSSEKRLARALLLLANFGIDGEQERVIPNISQETLAEMVGTTRSRVNFFMNKFRRLGFIKYNGTLEVHSSLLNVLVHD